ncbi:hypothetical protein [Myroides guanonis]|uniref:Lipoprotein n=1 Tax=Myroides guanonis TaxID=1150112 RepID=A0A1I3TXL0_9FLAO|nr:hypothetical protein [Myroides guanonis]SFJ76028.1 hypothetical protein SAMN04487893_11558 [Myroides guanonis]
MKKLALLVGSLVLLSSCNKNSMELSRASYTVIDNIEDHSPIYFEVNKEHSDSLIVNKNNVVSGTNFILSVSRDLNLETVLKESQKIKEDKYKDKVHPDSKGIFFSYADTLHKNLAFFPIKNIEFAFLRPQNIDNLLYMNASKDLFFETKPVEREGLKELLKQRADVQLGFSKSLNFESYLQLRVFLEENDLDGKFEAVDMVY